MSNNGSLSDRSLGKVSLSKDSLGREKTRGKADAKYVRIPRVPVEWYGNTTSWRLPSGKALAEFALQAGFLAPLLFKTNGFASTGLPSLGVESGHRSRTFKKADHA